jgi:outer membrane immunogenic protein
MKRLIATAVATAACCGATAFAADMPLKAPYKADPPASWTGCHIGANVGYARQRNRVVDPVGPFDTGTDTQSAVADGGQIGCDYQVGHWVFGAQGLFDATDINGSHRYIGGNSSLNETVGFKTSWFTTATARIGYTVTPQTLLYARGGTAWVHERLSDVDPTPFLGYVGQAEPTRSGWTAGAGLEYAFAPGWSVFAEYDYIGLGSSNVAIHYLPFSPFNVPYTFRFTDSLQTAMVGVNLRFGELLR